jgi:hypothetical protein
MNTVCMAPMPWVAVPPKATARIFDVVGRGMRQRGENRGRDDLDAQHEQIAGGEQHVADEAEDPCLPDLTQVHAGDAGKCQRGHERLCGAANGPVGGGDRRDVHRWVVDLDADEQQSIKRPIDRCVRVIASGRSGRCRWLSLGSVREAAAPGLAECGQGGLMSPVS